MESPIEPDEHHVVDARLVERFAVCRDRPAGHEAQPDAGTLGIVAQVASRPGARRQGPVVARARKVVVSPSLTVVVVPGQRGVLIVLPDARTAFGAQTEAILDGSPIGSIGPLLVGLAPDGVEQQPVMLSDGSEIQAPVVSNVYAVTDPSWTSPEFA
jgi:hypothetical protein